MYKYFATTLAVSMLFGSCAENKTETNTAEDTVKEAPKTLETLDFNSLDTTTSPKVDFYQFACGNWLANNPIPEEESTWSNFNVLDNSNNDILKTLLEEAQKNPGEKGQAKQFIGDLYQSFSDTNTRNAMGIKPIEGLLSEIDAISNLEGLQNQITKMHDLGISSGFSIYVSQDAKFNDNYAIYLEQGGLGLPNREYYFKKDDRSVTIRNAYQEHLNKTFQMAIAGENKNLVPFTYELEEKLAEKSWPPAQLRDIEAQYNKMTISDLSEMAPGFDWAKYFADRNIAVDSVIVGQKDFFTQFSKVFANTSIDAWKAYLKWNVLNESATALTMDMERLNFEFYSTVMRGTKKMKPLWKRGVMMVSRSPVGQCLGEVFVQDNFSQDAKNKVNEMVANITLVFEERIATLDWMSAETKVKAKEKLGTFVRKLGFPDEWKTYPGLEISADNYYQNQMNLSQFSVKENMAKLGKEIDKEEWHMVPQMVNAYYNPLLNEIVFPAGIMQKPFFSENFEDAVNYARMGAVIGHELTHGFDDQGSQFDATGAMVNWWTPEDKAKFDAKTQLLIDQYNAFEVLEGVFVNGELTLGENIADLGGLTIAYYAYKKSLEGKEDVVINGYNNAQRFFIAFGHVWQNNIRESALVQRVNTDPHSPGKYRVNGTLANMPEFFEAFDVQEGDPMRQPEDKIARIW